MVRKLFRDLSFVFVFSLLAAALSYVIRFVLTRKLTVEQYGLFYAVFSFIGLFVLFKNMRLISALIKLVPEYRVKNKFAEIKQSVVSVFFINFVVSLILGVFFILIAPTLSTSYFGHIDSIRILYLLTGFFVFSTLVEVIAASFMGLEQNIFYVLRELFINGIVLLFVLFYPLFDVTTPALGYLLATLLVFIVYLFAFMIKNKKILSLKVKYEFKIIKELIKFGAPMLLILAGARLIQFLDTAVLTYFRSLTEVGIYNVALPIAMLLIVLVGEMGAILSPLVSELKARGNNNALKVGFEMMQKYGFFLAVPVGLIFFSYAETIIDILFGADYIAGANALRILITGGIFYAIYKLNIVGISFVGKPKAVTKIVLTIAFFDLILNLLLVPRYGIEGAAFATAISFLLAFILSIKATKKHLNVNYPLGSWGLIILLGIVTLFFIDFIKGFTGLGLITDGIIVLFIAAVFYILMGIVLRIINIKEIKGLLWNQPE